MEEKSILRGAHIEIRGLTKSFDGPRGRTTAIDGLDLTVERGEFLCVVGPSGCGKSSLLRILAGLESHTTGSIKIDAPGAEILNAMVFQESGLFPWMTIEENIGFGLMTRGVPESASRSRVSDAMKVVGLSKFHAHYPHQVSGGMRQRAAIARAFVTDPAMLLMDEPFAALDAQNRTILQEELLKIWEATRKTVVYITHSLEEALFLGDRAVVMTAHPGRIKEIIEVPFERPRNLIKISTTPEFAELRLRIWSVLEDEVNRARVEAGEFSHE